MNNSNDTINNPSPPNLTNSGGVNNGNQHVRISQSKLPSLNQIISDPSFSNVPSPHSSNSTIPRLSSPSIHNNGNNGNNNNSGEYPYLYKSSSGSDLSSSSNGNSPNHQQFNFKPIQTSPSPPSSHHSQPLSQPSQPQPQHELLKKRDSQLNNDKTSPSEYSSPLSSIIHQSNNEEDNGNQYKHQYSRMVVNENQNNPNYNHNNNSSNNNNNPNNNPNNHHTQEENSSDDSIDSNEDSGYELLQHNNIANGLMIFQDALSTEEVYSVYNKYKSPITNKQQPKQQIINK